MRFFIGSIISVFFLVFSVLNNQAQTDLPESVAALWQQAQSQPEDFGVACMPVNGGRPVLYNGDRFPLASVSKILIFIEYAQRLDTGEIQLGETVSLAALERYNLPRTDRGAHDRFIAQYAAGTTSLPLWEVATDGMIQFSSNAASDYLLDRLAPVDWDALYATLGIFQTDVPTPLTMIPLLMNNHDTGRVGQNDLDDLSALDGEMYMSLYVNDSDWRQDEIAYRSGGSAFIDRSGSIWPSWDVQSTILQAYTATGNVNDFRNIMNAIYSQNSPLSGNVQYMTRTAMQWSGNQYISDNYAEYGSKLGFYSGGVMTLIAYGDAYAGTPTISVIFMRNIPRRDYYDLLREDSIGDFAHWLNFNGCDALKALIDTELNADH